MKFIADFHIHSKYSRATSRDMDVDHLVDWAKFKGIDLLGSGDFTHHLWLEELKSKLKPAKGKGIYEYKGVHFILTTEVSSIYSKNGKNRRIHNMVFAPSFEVVDKINQYLSGIGNIASDGRPILGLDSVLLARAIFNIDPNCMIIPGHIWTPWFSLFGSMSGFDKIEECFEEQTKNIFALETGLSSDPAMNWRLSALDKFTLVSNSDSHSPQKLGREANVFDTNVDYYEIRDTLKTKDKKRFLFTVEFFPEEGKYHFDGHRNCNVSFSPAETRQHNNRCPKCGRPLTVGVMNRVEQLADRPEGFIPHNAIPFKNLVPLVEIVAEARGTNPNASGVEKEYRALIQKFGNEFNILLNISEKELKESVSAKISKGIVNAREGKVKRVAGYDGVYGKISVFSNGGDKNKEEQLSLF